MKVTTTTTWEKPTKSSPKYPWVGIYNGNDGCYCGRIAVFISKNTSILLHESTYNTENDAGTMDFKPSSTRCLESSYVPFTGTVTMKFE